MRKILGRKISHVPSASASFFIKDGYRPRAKPEYFVDDIQQRTGLIHQPAVYPFARYLAERFGCQRIVDVGCGRGENLKTLHPDFGLVGVDHGPNIEYCRSTYRFGRWLSRDLERNRRLGISADLGTGIVCSDVIEHLIDPSYLLANLRDLLQTSAFGILSTPERDLVRGVEDMGPPGNPAHVREWNLAELSALVDRTIGPPSFAGLTYNNNRDLEKKTSIVIFHDRSWDFPAPSFKVLAVMTAYNEQDVIASSIKNLVSQGIMVHVIENWSTDATFSIVQAIADADPAVTLERFPPEGPTPYYQWRHLLARVEEVAARSDADWLIHHDADEIRESPWPDVDLRTALFRVGREGFNAVDHTVIVFHPVDDRYDPDSDLASQFAHFEFGKRPGHFQQVKAWENVGRPGLVASGGHLVEIPGRRVYPFKFLTRHYPIRSQRHGEAKVFRDRVARSDPEEKRLGWHVQYGQISRSHQFLKNPAELHTFDASFYERFAVERLSGVGVQLDRVGRVLETS